MQRKGPPYKVEFCAIGQEPPAYVSAILHGRVVLGGSQKQLSRLGLRKEIGFRDLGLFEQNQELISLMLHLRE